MSVLVVALLALASAALIEGEYPPEAGSIRKGTWTFTRSDAQYGEFVYRPNTTKACTHEINILLAFNSYCSARSGVGFATSYFQNGTCQMDIEEKAAIVADKMNSLEESVKLGGLADTCVILIKNFAPIDGYSEVNARTINCEIPLCSCVHILLLVLCFPARIENCQF